MKTQYLLLLGYAMFVALSLSYWAFEIQSQNNQRLEPELVADWQQQIQSTSDVEDLNRLTVEVVDTLERRETHTVASARLLHTYLVFALLATLPLAAYAGQSMRDKLFVTRPVNMPRIVYWTLFGVSTRRMAVRYMWLSVILALCSSAVALVTPIGFLGLFSLVTAYLYQNAIEWVDKNAYWANQTMAPFPFGR